MTYKEYVPTEMKNPAAWDEQLHRRVCPAGTRTGKQIFKTDVADKRAERKKNPSPPFTTPNLQQEASRKLNMTV